MAANIGPKIGIDGEAEYRKQINQVIQQAKTLDSEMKLVASSFDEDTKQKKKNAEVGAVIVEQIKNQKERVSLLADMVEKSAEKYGENATETLKWKEALNTASVELNDMEKKVDKHGRALVDDKGNAMELTEANKELADSMKDGGEKAASFGDILKANLISEAIVAGVKAIGDAIKSLGSEMVSIAKDSAAFADNFLTLSTNTGLSTETLQEYQYMAELTDTSLETITGSLTKLTKNMSSAKNGSKTTAAAFEALGVAITDENGNLRDNEAVFGEIIDALGQMDNQTERDAASMAIFGKSAQDLNSFIAQGADGIAAFRQEAHDMGYVLDEDALGSLGAVDDAFQRLDLMSTSLKNQIGLALAPAITDLSDDFMGFAQEAISSVSDVSAAFREGGLGAGMEALGTLISDWLAKLAESLPEVMTAGMDLLGAIGDGISENLPMLTSTALDVVLTLAEGLIESLPDVIKSGLEIIVALATGIADSLPELIPTIVDVVLQIVDTLTDPETLGSLIDASLAIIVALADGVIDSVPELLEKAPEIVQNLVDAVIENAPKLLKSAAELIVKLVEGIAENLPQLLDSAADIVSKVVEGIVATFAELVMAGKEIVDSVKNGFDEKLANAKQWGKDLLQNFIDGITEKWNALKEKVSSIAGTVKDFLGFSEPEKGPLSNFHTFAPDMMDLFMKGITQKTPELEGLITETFDLQPYMRSGQPAGSTVNHSYGSVTFNIYTQPDQDAEEIADEVERRIVGGWGREEAVYA